METLRRPDLVSIRDSKQTHAFADADLQPMLHLSPEVFGKLLDEVAGTAQPGSNGSVLVEDLDDGGVRLSAAETSVTLSYDADEWSSFRRGIAAGEFS